MEPLPPAEGARALAEAAGVHLLTELGILRVTGDDARAWLNGQITNDVALSEKGQAVYALVLSLKGRVLSDLWVLDHGDAFDLVLPLERRGAVAEHLDGYIIMEDVELEPDDERVVVSVQGPAAATVAQRASGGPFWACDRLGTEGRDRIVPRAEAQAALAALADESRALGGGLVDDAAWTLARLRAGVPRMGADFGENTYPQEAGLKARAVSFGKGCYQGQEAVVMLEHRGKPPKKLAHLSIDATAAPEPGAAIADAGGTPVGTLTSAAVDPSTPGRCVGLGYLKRDHARTGEGFRVDGAPATVRAVIGG